MKGSLDFRIRLVEHPQAIFDNYPIPANLRNGLSLISKPIGSERLNVRNPGLDF